ncbi:MAG: hypothetical protein WDN31_22895 [Hyphomicrobium sp.]
MRWIERIFMVVFGAWLTYAFVLAVMALGAIAYVVGTTIIYGTPKAPAAGTIATVRPSIPAHLANMQTTFIKVQNDLRPRLVKLATENNGMLRDYTCAMIALLNRCQMLTIVATTDYQIMQAGQCMEGLDYEAVVLQYRPEDGCP